MKFKEIREGKLQFERYSLSSMKKMKEYLVSTVIYCLYKVLMLSM